MKPLLYPALFLGAVCFVHGVTAGDRIAIIGSVAVLAFVAHEVFFND